MIKKSRTSMSIKNSAIALSFFCAEFILKFFARSIFLKVLGDELLGLNSTMMNILQFLNLAELGIGAAIGFTLYKPIAENDVNSINEIIHLNGHLYKRIAIIILVGGIILMPFFPMIFHKTHMPLWYPYATFITFLIGLLLNYWINYKQILLSASQMDYKIQLSYRSTQLIKTLTQIFAVYYFSQPYIWWLLIELIFSAMASFILDYTIKKTFPYLSSKLVSYRHLKQKYNIVIKKIKQLFLHKICGFILTQTSSLIIYAILSLSVVTYYTNYIMITSGITQLFNAMFNSMTNSIGNLVAEGNKQKIINVYGEIFSLRFIISVVCCFALIILSKPFISLWIGSQYVLPTVTLYIIVGTTFIALSRTTTDAFLYAYGMYQDIWSPIIEAIINIGLSITLGIKYGLNGILSGTLISLILVVWLWKPYFLFVYGFRISIIKYIALYLKHLIASACAFLIWFCLFRVLRLSCNEGSLFSFICYTLWNILIFCCTLLVFLIIAKAPICQSFKRIKAIKH